MRNLFRPTALTPRRIGLAFVIAVAVDGFQLMLGPLGWTFLDEIVDVAAMLGIGLLIGFHPLLLPTFIIEVIPVADMLPTWTGCVAVVVALRRKQQQSPAPPRAARPPDVIDV